MNHPDVDPYKLDASQAEAISGYLAQIKQLERDYDEMKLGNRKIKEQ